MLKKHFSFLSFVFIAIFLGASLIYWYLLQQHLQRDPIVAQLGLMLFFIALLILLFWRQHRQTNAKDNAIEALINQWTQPEPDKPFAEQCHYQKDSSLLYQLNLAHFSQINDLTEKLTRAHQFTANVTHELRTPLTILRGESELALRTERSNNQLRNVLESNLEEIRRMSRLIDDLLLLSKSELGEVPISQDLLYLPELILELQHQAKILAKQKNITIKLDWQSNQDIYLNADNFRLRQVFLNLLTNAIRYTPTKGTITIKVEPHEQKVNICIIDTGIGISSEHLDHIFERFYRVGKTKNRNDGGSGLGLAIAHWIVEAHNGQISAQSQPGKGSRFTVTLPINNEFTTEDPH
jgi:signal transduction histidine kinase